MIEFNSSAIDKGFWLGAHPDDFEVRCGEIPWSE